MMQNDVDLDWLEEKLDREDYRKLEKYIMNLCLKKEIPYMRGFRRKKKRLFINWR